MNPLCNLCGAQRALVYCNSDSARLCLPCDAYIHYANAISYCHLRAQLCDSCHALPAASICPDDRLALCDLCDLVAFAAPRRRRIPIGFYAGCPSSAELSAIFSAASDPVDDSCAALELPSGLADPMEIFEPAWIPSPSSCIVPDSTSVFPCGEGQAPFFSQDCNLARLDYAPLKDFGMGAGHQLCDGLEIGEGAFNVGNNEMFGLPRMHAGLPFLDSGLDEIFMQKNLSAADSNCHLQNAVGASSSMPQDCATTLPTCMVASSSIVQAANSNAAGYQDYGVSPLILASESTWDSNLEITCPRTRNEAKKRYNEKKKNRLFGKQIRYASRKARADTRKRVKGRFVKTGEPYDYDPLIISK